MLPFSTVDFFLVAGSLVAFLYLSKFVLYTRIKFSTSILLVSLFFLLVFYPKPWHIIFFISYSYIIYYLLNSVLKQQNKLPGVILLVLPMILVKSEIRFHFYPFSLNDIITFAGLSYISFRIVSVYLEAVPGDKPVNFIKYTNFLIFTPTLLIGPIDRYKRFQDDLEGGYSRLNFDSIIKGWELIAQGILYKYVIAELLDRYWLNLFSPDSKMTLDVLGNMFGYFLYLFFDFAGYSAMAIGFGKMMGIDVPINFNKPFLARNPQEFWQRFHKTLGDWLRDYFFKPLYMFFSRKKSLSPYPLARQNIALFFTFLLMGLWNGFHTNFIISGIMFSLSSVVHNSYAHYCKKHKRDIIFGSLPDGVVKWISILGWNSYAALAIYVFSGRCPFI